MSISFTALIQTLKADPQMVKLIQDIPRANDGEQHKDNDNITNYLEANKDKILDLDEKYYENLIEAFTKNAINDACALHNPILSSLPANPSSQANQSDNTYRKEKSEIHHNSKGDSDD
jgi:hypothetical protein